MTDPDADALPIAEFAFPGPLRDRLVAAILDGSKTSTSSTVAEYAVENEPEPRVGRKQMVVDSGGAGVAIIEVIAVERVALRDVSVAHAIGEGEGYTSVQEWRAAHERYWQSQEMREYLGDPNFAVDDSTPLFLERFAVIERLGLGS